MRPPRTLTRSVRIAFTIGVLMMDAVRGNPEDGSAFECKGAAPRQEVLDPLVGLVAAMGEQAMIGQADAQRAGYREQQTSPSSGAWRIKPHARSFRQQDECDHGQACQRAYDQCQDQKYLFFTLLQLAKAA